MLESMAMRSLIKSSPLLREECELDRDLGYELMRRTAQVMLQRLEAMNSLLVRTLSDALRPSA